MIIYKTTNLVNGKIYVGKDTLNNINYIGSGKLIQRAISKYGKENFKKEILEECFTKEELNEREIYWIKKLKSQDKNIGYNITSGGDGGATRIGIKQTEETKKKIRSALKNQKLSEETKKKISKSLSGKNHPMYGKKLSEETKKKIGKANSISLKGNKQTEETRKKISKSLLGHFVGNETKEKIRKKLIKPVIQYDLDGNFIKEFESIKEASKKTGCLSSKIVRVAKGYAIHTKKIKWKYK